MAINSLEVEELVRTARSKKLFLMEAMWTRFLPAIQHAKHLVDQKVIGELRMLHANFGFETSDGPDGRHLNPEFADGALLDVGIYPISIACYFFGKEPVSVKSLAAIGQTGVDEISAYLLAFDKMELALLSSAVKLNTLHDAVLTGTQGKIIIPNFWHAEKLILQVEGESEKVLEFPFECNGYEYEIREVVKCVSQQQTESSVMPLEESLKIMSIMDGCRKEWNLTYPGEQA